jgi:hypothetical protein
VQWTLVEGVFCGRAYARRREAAKSRPLERSASSPFVGAAPAESAPDDDEGARTADDTLSGDLQRFFLQAVNLLRDDVLHTGDAALALLSSERKLQPLVPHFLQWAFGRMALGLHSAAETRAVVALATALARNRAVALPLFAHPFAKIAMTALLAAGIAVDTRAEAAKLLAIVADRCEGAFRDVRTAIANALLGALLNPRTSLGAHYGALRAIAELRIDVDHRLLAAYGAAVEPELECVDTDQSTWAARVLGLLRSPEFA